MKEKRIKVLIGNVDRYILIDGEYFPVMKMPDDISKLRKNIAYFDFIRYDVVRVYRGKFDPEINVPGIYRNKGKLMEIFPSEKEKEKYSIHNIQELNMRSMIEEISASDDVMNSPEYINMVNANADVYNPEIKETDDFLKVAIKRVIQDKQINLSNYRDKFINDYSLTNMKSALTKSTKMTVLNFVKWAEILGFTYTLIIEDDGTDTLSPLPNTIVVNRDDMMGYDED